MPVRPPESAYFACGACRESETPDRAAGRFGSGTVPVVDLFQVLRRKACKVGAPEGGIPGGTAVLFFDLKKLDDWSSSGIQ